jgi:hypothetical protein
VTGKPGQKWKRTYDNTLIRIHSTEEERRDLVPLQVEAKCRLSAQEPERRSLRCQLISFVLPILFLRILILLSYSEIQGMRKRRMTTKRTLIKVKIRSGLNTLTCISYRGLAL